MRPQDIKIGETYRLRSSPRYGFVKALQVLKAKEHPNTHSYAVVKCEHTVNRSEEFGYTRYFRPVDMIKADQA